MNLIAEKLRGWIPAGWELHKDTLFSGDGAAKDARMALVQNPHMSGLSNMALQARKYLDHLAKVNSQGQELGPIVHRFSLFSAPNSSTSGSLGHLAQAVLI